MRTLWKWLVELDRILRGETTRVADLRDGEIKIPLRGILVVLVLLGMLYGLCMGCYAVVNHGRGMQMLASMVKVPALFLCTLAVTLPSLYVFNALVGSRLTGGSLFRLFIAALGVNLAVLSSLGPIVAFFSINTTSYGFMVLLNVVVFAVAGLLSMAFLLQTLHRLHIAPRAAAAPATTTPATEARSTVPSPEAPNPGDAAPANQAGKAISEAEVLTALELAESGPLEPVAGHVPAARIKMVFGLWMIVFGLVGAQMSWVLRPFIGSPDQPFEWFRARGSNFFEAVWKALMGLMH